MKSVPGLKMFKSLTATEESKDQALLAAAVMPVDFFEVKRTPRGTYGTMGIFTILTLIATLTAFSFLAFEGSKGYTIVSEVKTEDITGTGGYECTMISKANDEYALGDNATFILVNVMESQAECAAALAAAAPCASDNLQFEASSDPTEVTFDDVGYGAIAFDFSGNLWFVDMATGYAQFAYFTPSTEKNTDAYTSSSQVQYLFPGKLAMGPDGTAVYAITKQYFWDI